MQLQRSMVYSIENILKEDGKFSNLWHFSKIYEYKTVFR